MSRHFNETTWAIRAGKRGSAHDLFLDKGVVALEDANLGDLAKYNPTREDFVTAYWDLHPSAKQAGAHGIGGKYFRFACEMQIGDTVLYPAFVDRQIYIGVVSGPYDYKSTSNLPHERKVIWKFVIPKTALSTEAGRELGAARTFFRFRKNTREVLALISSKSATSFRQSNPSPSRQSSKTR